MMMCTIPQLDGSKLKEVQSLEQKIGKTLVAYTCQDVAPAKLSETEISQLKETEQKLGVVLVAVGK
ncbi:MAG: hypothetical protein IT388_07385 [Nitrospirales bacterium]|nr:hypothetical protein [Nitrospirales bacterium]